MKNRVVWSGPYADGGNFYLGPAMRFESVSNLSKSLFRKFHSVNWA